MPRVAESSAKRLFAVSGNRCAFPECPLPLVDPKSGTLTGRICHIKAKNEGGKRYDASQADEERNAFANLILMCAFHHDVIDADERAYTVERLHELKREHERRFEHGLEPSDEIARSLIEISEVTVERGSFLVALNQTGGQMAHSITNINVPPPHRTPRLQVVIRRVPHERRPEFTTLEIRLYNIGDAKPSDARVTLRFPQSMNRHTTQDALKSNRDGVTECERTNEYFREGNIFQQLYPGDATQHSVISIHYFLEPDRANDAAEEFQIVTRSGDEPPFVARMSFGDLSRLSPNRWYALSDTAPGETSTTTPF